MSDRFFSTELIVADSATLAGSEAHHLLHVMRVALGDEITLFDGSGAEFPAVVAELKRASVELRIVARREIDRELPLPLVVGVALPKGDRQKWLVEKLSELGVTALVPLATARGVAQPSASALDRLRRTAIEAAKQCGRNRLMQIAPPQTWSEWISAAPTPDAGRSAGPAERRATCDASVALADEHRLVADPGGPSLADFGLARFAEQPARISIGPEGGLAPDEVAAAVAAGWQPVGLGPRILRVETAAVALAAAVSCAQQSPRP